MLLTVSVVIWLLAGLIDSSEPECPRYHFAEKTLERVIKLDFLVEKMKEDLEAKCQQIINKVESVETDQRMLKVDLDKHIEKNDKEISDLKEKNVEVIERVQKTKESPVTPTVAFLGKDVAKSTPAGQKFVFNTTVLNEGNGYDRATGIFTVPVSGTYLFTVQFCVNTDGYLDYSIVADDKILKRGWFWDKELSTCETADALAVLSSGSRVWVSSNGGGATVYPSTNHFNSFSGVILHV